jgi:hypothetical protein
MPITTERTVAQAMVNDAYGVELWQEHKAVDYTTDEARQLAAEILAAADEADTIERVDRDAALDSDACAFIQFPSIALELTDDQAIKVAAFELDHEETSR